MRSHLSHLPSLLHNPPRHPFFLLQLPEVFPGASCLYPRGFPPRKGINYIPFFFTSSTPIFSCGGKMSPIKEPDWESNLGLLLLSTFIKIRILSN